MHGLAIRWAETSAINEDCKKGIAERKQMKMLFEDEGAFRAILNNSPNLIFLKDMEGRYQLVNKMFEETVHLSEEQIKGKRDDEIFPPEQAAAFRANDLQIQQTGMAMTFEEVAVHGDGSRTSIVQKFPIRDEHGMIYATAGIVIDITERKHAEAETLALKNELATDLISMSLLHEFSTKLLISTALQPILEEFLDAIIGLHHAAFGFVHLYNPQSRALEIVAHRNFSQDCLNYFRRLEDDHAGFGRAMHSGKRVLIADVQTEEGFGPYRSIAADAGFRACHSTPLLKRNGEILGMISTHFRRPHRPSDRELRYTDIYARQVAEMIERKMAEEALRTSEERFHRYFELGLIGMAITSPTKGILELNDELCRILGYERSELLQKTWTEMTHPDDLADDVAQFNRVMAGEIDGYTLDKRWIRKDGRVIDSIMSAKCMRRADGSVDYFVKLVQDITERKQAYEELRILKDKLAYEKQYLESEIRSERGFEEIIGQSQPLRVVLRQIEKVAPTDTTVLIQGETGTGKELIARAIHNLSKRRDKTFVRVNCAAIPTGLLESELFGHQKGAFTGAIKQKVGRFELGHEGTIFLDEVGEIPLELQVKLLRVLQEQEFERLGSTRTQHVDIRVLAATNRDLAHMVAEKQFRSDLYYRLNVFPIRAPALRQRSEDIPDLVRFFTKKYARQLNKPISRISDATMQALCRYTWPGNIRELENIIERSAILSASETLELDQPLLEFHSDDETPRDATTLEEAERDLIRRTLIECHWVLSGPSGAAKKLGMKRTSLQYKMQKLGIARPRGG